MIFRTSYKNSTTKIISFIFVFLSLNFVSCSKKNLKNSTGQEQIGLQFFTEGYVPKKIVSLSPAATEILCTIGAYEQIAARTDFCDFPQSVSNLPSVGGFDGQTLSMEKILSFSPDFVYATSGMHDQFFPLLIQQKIPFYVSYASSVDSVLKEIEEIGKITGHAQEASSLTKNMKERLNSVQQKYEKSDKVSVYWEVWNPPYMSIGKESFINELIQIAGGKNIFDSLSEPYPIVSEEAILSANPAVIVISDAVTDGISAVKQRSGWQNINAVQQNKIYAMQTDLFFRPCPRIPDAVELIADALHKED